MFTCSLAARGLWHEMMNMMHVSENYGYLGNKGKAYTPEAIARYCGASLEEYLTLLTELDSVGIPRRNSDGIIYSKRMVEDEKKRKQWRARQSKFRKNNNIDGNDVTRDVTQMSRDCPPDLHSSSSSSSSNLNSNTKPAQTRRGDHTPEQIRKIESNAQARQEREHKENEFRKEARVGSQFPAGPDFSAMTDEEWQKHLDSLDPKRKVAQ